MAISRCFSRLVSMCMPVRQLMELSEDLCFWCLPVRRIHLPFLSIDAFSRFLHLRHIACRSQGFGDPYLGQNVVGGLWFGFLAGVAWGVGEELQSQWAAFKDGWPVGPSHAIAALGLGLHALPAVAGDPPLAARHPQPRLQNLSPEHNVQKSPGYS